MPCSAWTERRRPSKEKGRVTTPIVSAPRFFAISATTGAPPVPVPPPLPAVMKTMSAPLSVSSDRLLDLLALRLGGLPAHLGVAAGAQTPGEVAADVELGVGVAHQQRLG